MTRTALLLALAVLATASCKKVPITDIGAYFLLADAAWFEQEETLFVFYRVDASQGLGTESQVELTWRTDTMEQPWTALSALTPVHTHEAVDCGPRQKCGSYSVHVPSLPRDVQLRLRYHKDGELVLNTNTLFNVVGAGPAHTNRSLLVYGVFDESNTHVQWRARHQFPTLRNEEVQALGLRRSLRIEDARHGTLEVPVGDNPYAYALLPGCPDTFAPLASGPLETQERAIFDGTALPLSASTSASVCARSTVTDARGTFEAMALARKNPEVSPAFPLLRSPIRTDTQVGFVLRPCNRTISEEHLSMQVQRLLLEGQPEVCIDDWQAEDFASRLATTLRQRIDAVRAQGNDMILTLALHHDVTGGGFSSLVERVLEQVLVPERDRTSPRVSGAFVLDSFGYTLTRAQLSRLAVWCPLKVPVGGPPVPSEGGQCAVADRPDLELGPLKLNQLPIFATRQQYLDFIDKYSEGQAGRVRTLTFRAPERTPLSQNVPVGEFGVITFFNNEVLTAAPTDVFSYCPPTQQDPFFFRVGSEPTPQPLAMLPTVHTLAPQPNYPLGLGWDFPYLLRLEIEVVTAGAVSAYGFSVPFGIPSTQTPPPYGREMWETGEFPLGNRLLRCTRFCDHPTFNSAGAYEVGSPFRAAYQMGCYSPDYPALGDGGFPLDP